MRLAALWCCLSLLAGCGGPRSAGPGAAPSDQVGAGTDHSVATAKAMLNGGATPEPGPFQHRLLAKTTLTYADYESAMQAMAQCVEDRLPGAVVRLTPGLFQPHMLDSSMSYGIAPAPDTVSTVNGGATSGSESSAPDVTAPGAGEGTAAAEPDSQPRVPDSSAKLDAAQGECSLTYSAYVEDRWRQQLVLDAAQEDVQKPQFLQCMTAAGVILPQDQSDGSLKRFLTTPAWFEGLTAAQNVEANRCLQQYAELVNTVTR